MNRTWKIVIIVVLIIAVITVLTIKREISEQVTGAVTTEVAANIDESTRPNQLVSKELPRLLDLGSDQCIPCKMMAPVLEELKTEYAGKLQVDFIDVWKDPEQAGIYDIKLIPTQIFYDASGKELFRHEGFYSKEDILTRWRELGVDLTQAE
jgi:thioredoxin 1